MSLSSKLRVGLQRVTAAVDGVADGNHIQTHTDGRESGTAVGALPPVPAPTPALVVEPSVTPTPVVPFRLRFLGDRLVEAEGTLALLDGGIDLAECVGLTWPEIGTRLGGFARGLDKEIQTLLDLGVPVLTHATLPGGGLVRIEGETQGPSAVVTGQPASAGERVLAAQLAALGSLYSDQCRLQAERDALPVAVFDFGPGGELVSANARARDLVDGDLRLDQLDKLLPDVRGRAGGKAPGSSPGPSSGVPEGLSAAQPSVRVTRCGAPGGGVFVFVEDISDLTHAEQQYSSMVTTLTDTFAHLSVGLAVFDARRKLTLFNPALSDLFGLPPAQLVAMPTVKMFLEVLRRARKLPEQTNYIAWRDRLIARLDQSVAVAFSEDWTLPDGQILRVSARPHPRASVALMFEDISGRVNLERRYRTEIELGQATLDRLSEAVAVLSSSGRVLFANAAFETSFGFNAFAEIMAEGIDPLVDLAAEIYSPREAWTDLKAYALAADRVERWDRVLTHIGGETVMVRASALPDGSTLLTVPARARGSTHAVDPDTVVAAAPGGDPDLSAAMGTTTDGA